MPIAESALQRINWEPFYNNSGQVIPAYAAMHHNGDEDRAGNFIMKMEQPSTTFRRIFYINGPVAVAIGAYGSCTRYCAYALCDSGNTPAQEECWGPKPSSWKLWKGYPGATILGGETGTGDAQRAKVVCEPPNRLLAKAQSTEPSARSSTTPGSGTVDVLYMSGTTLTDTTWDVTAYNLSTDAVSDGEPYLQLLYHSGKWFVDYEDCGP